jgi:excisionase family DNA binding protein
MRNPAANRQVSNHADAESTDAAPASATKGKGRGARISTFDFQQLPTVLTSREAANVLRVGVREVRTLVDSGQLAGTRLGPRKVIRISRSALLALMRVQSAG